ncbi:hypothetical protein [Bacillus wiedmannii]|uniref:hypothetical protein n=1 Tax=Bacillus wiedmannii TaxID=1890302 RepID=UPI000BF2C5AF|nr:hypothetical protein [Bacillus wiedmannii]PFZ64889.1 hypothetical protein COL76_13140 [Bacillus wiedmannii]
MTTVLKEKAQEENVFEVLKKVSHSEDEYRLLSEIIERLEEENIQVKITDGYFNTIVFAKFPELGNSSLRFAITAPKNRYALECYYDFDDTVGQPPLMHLVSARGLVKQTVINRIKHIAENLDEIVREHRISKTNNHI